MKKAFCKMCVTICGRFRPDEGAVAGYGNRIRVKYTAKWGVQFAGMIFQMRSDILSFLLQRNMLKYSKNVKTKRLIAEIIFPTTGVYKTPFF